MIRWFINIIRDLNSVFCVSSSNMLHLLQYVTMRQLKSLDITGIFPLFVYHNNQWEILLSQCFMNETSHLINTSRGCIPEAVGSTNEMQPL